MKKIIFATFLVFNILGFSEHISETYSSSEAGKEIASRLNSWIYKYKVKHIIAVGDKVIVIYEKD